MRNHFSAECLFIFPPSRCLPACLQARLREALMGSAMFSEDLLSLSEPRDAAGGTATLSTGGAALRTPDGTGRDGILFSYCGIKQKASLLLLGTGGGNWLHRRLEGRRWLLFHILCCDWTEKVR